MRNVPPLFPDIERTSGSVAVIAGSRRLPPSLFLPPLPIVPFRGVLSSLSSYSEL